MLMVVFFSFWKIKWLMVFVFSGDETATCFIADVHGGAVVSFALLAHNEKFHRFSSCGLSVWSLYVLSVSRIHACEVNCELEIAPRCLSVTDFMFVCLSLWPCGGAATCPGCHPTFIL